MKASPVWRPNTATPTPVLPVSHQPCIRVVIALAVASLGSILGGQNVRINEISAYPTPVPEPGDQAGEGWRSLGYDDSSWGKSILPVGMDTGTDYNLPVNLQEQMFGKATTLYVRSEINLSSALIATPGTVVLSIDYDDAFVLYINGFELKRNNIGTPGTTPVFDAQADGTHRASNDTGDGVNRVEKYHLGPASGIFQPGHNIIAVQLINQTYASSDAFLDLSIDIGTTPVTSHATVWRYFIGTEQPEEVDRLSGVESDWIELYNATATDLNLEGWSLSDSTGNIRKWVFPSVLLPADGYLLVLATGEDRKDPESWLETSFKLSSSGEFLGLFDKSGNVVSQFVPGYPPQARGSAYGWNEASEAFEVFTTLTPGMKNGNSTYEGMVGDPAFSVGRGFYDEPFRVELSSGTEGAEIRYTTDGSTPTEAVGQLYTGPVPITTTTVLRAIAFKEGYLSTKVYTHSYIFLNDVIRQDNRPEGFPTTWKNVSGNTDLPADYEMDPEVTEDPRYQEQMRESLLSVPTISLVTDIGNLFDRGNGIYMNPKYSGMAWERPVSVEWIYPNGKEGFQINGGIRVQGGHTRDPRKTPKRSFRLAFRKDYGDGTLEHQLFPEPDATDEFDTIILRGGANQSWLHHNQFRGDNRGRAQYIRDQFAKDMQGRMGSPHLHNGYAFLYINGLFWGLYNPTERATNAYGEAYLGGDEDDYDALNSGELKDGDMQGWNALMALVNKDLSVKVDYDRVAELLDLQGFTDYMILNHWGGNEDWDHHNWYALRNREAGKFHFFTWDSEFFFETVGANVTAKNTNNCPGEIFHSLLKNPEYRILVADRIHEHLNNDGALTPAEALKLWEERNAQVYLPLIAESARWGDYRRDVHRRAGPYELYTRDNQWAKERKRVVNTIIPVRASRLLLQYILKGLIPSTPAPEFSTQDGLITHDNPLIITTEASGNPVVYYTLDGTDPRMEGGSVSASAIVYNAPIPISGRTRVQARVLTNNVWSPVQSGNFYPAGDPADLQISEILYAPFPSGDFEGKQLEFIEIRNSGPAPVSLDQVTLDGGITFAFPSARLLGPGENAVVVSDQAAFQSQHPGVPVDGEFSGNLSNEGERISLRHATLGTIQEVVYSDWYPWPGNASEAGHSLVPVSFSDRGFPTQSTAWKASLLPGGSPGSDESSIGKWFHRDPLGWVYSETGELGPNAWIFSIGMGFIYLSTLDDYGGWIWLLQ